MTTDVESELTRDAEQRARMVPGVVESLRRIIVEDIKIAKNQKAMGETEAAEETLRKVARMKGELRTILENNRDVYDPDPDTIAIAAPAGTTGDDSWRSRATPLPEAILVSALILAGALLLSVVLATGANWFYAEMFFVLVVYLVWQRWL